MFELRQKLHRLATGKTRNALNFFVGFACQRLSQFAILPLVVSQLDAASFSRFGLMTSVLQLAPSLLTFRVHTSVGRLIFDTTLYDRRKLIATCFLGGLAPAFFLVFVYCSLIFLGGVDDPLSAKSTLIALSIGTLILSRIVVEFASTLFRSDGNSKRFMHISLVDGALYGCLGALALTCENPNFIGLVLAISIAGFISSMFCMFLLRKDVFSFWPEKSILADCFRYSWPTAVHGVGLWFSTQSTRWVGVSIIGLEGMASFSFVLLIASAVGLVSRIVFELSRPTAGKAFACGDVEEGKRILSKSQFYSMLVVIICFSVIILAYYIFENYLEMQFRITSSMFMLVFLYLLVDSWSLKITNLLLGMKFSKSLMFSSLPSGLVALCLTPPLCIWYQEYGLCLSLFVSAFVQAVLALILWRRVSTIVVS